MPVLSFLNIEPFAEHKDVIERLYLADDEFKALCDDYYTCKVNAEKLKNTVSEDKQRELEYRHLLLDLEKEILDYLQKRR